MNQDVESILNKLPKFQVDNLFKDQLLNRIQKETSVNPASPWKWFLTLSTSMAVVVLAITGIVQLNRVQQAPLFTPSSGSLDLLQPNLPSLESDDKKRMEPQPTPCILVYEPCDPKSCDYDEKKCLYKCPKSGYIDCMPIVASERQYQCSQPFLNWVKKNCPDFRGVTY